MTSPMLDEILRVNIRAGISGNNAKKHMGDGITHRTMLQH